MSNWFTIDDESVIGQIIIADDEVTAKSFLSGDVYSSDEPVTPGMIYNKELKIAIHPRQPKPYPSWVWDDELKIWRAPVGKRKPQDGKNYEWQEDIQTWLEV